MAVAGGLAGTAEGHRVQDGYVVLHHRRFADDDAGGMVEQDAAADRRRRMDVHAEADADLALEEQGQRVAPLPPQPVRHPVRLQGMETLEEKKRRGEVLAGRIAAVGGDDVAHRAVENVRVVRHGVVDDVADEHGRQHRIVELAGQPKGERGAEAGVVQDGGVEVAAEDRLFVRLGCGLLAHRAPHGLAVRARLTNRCVAERIARRTVFRGVLRHGGKSGDGAAPFQPLDPAKNRSSAGSRAKRRPCVY